MTNRSSNVINDSIIPFLSRILGGIATRFGRFGWDIGGVALLSLALMSLLGIYSPAYTGGKLIRIWVELLNEWFGIGSFFVVVILISIAVAMFRRRLPDMKQHYWKNIFALEAAFFAGLVILASISGGSIARVGSGSDGGLIGWGLLDLLNGFLSPLWINLISILIFFWGAVVGLNLSATLVSGIKRIRKPDQGKIAPYLNDGPVVSVAPVDEKADQLNKAKEKKKSPLISPEFRKQFRIQPDEEKPVLPIKRDDRLPPINLLIGGRMNKPNERHINQKAGLIEQTLAEFGIPAKVVDFNVGPTVTQFAVEPGFIEKPGSADEEARLRKVRVSQISSLQRDLSLALAAERLRVQAPVPGRPYVGIEVPNTRSSIVRLRPILETEAFYKIASPLAIALGRDVSGQPVVADLAAMPHLLIAGTTGSGKSVCIAALTACLVMNNSPEDLKIVMVDPKMVELVRFNGLPHLFGKVETDIERMLGVLRWVVLEMDRRYELLEKSRSRNIVTYNKKMRRRKDTSTLPRIVVLIDELADLMMSAPDQTEHNLVRLAQMARATGIHLVLATQRPSTDVVTGLIKANFPARMSFAVASSVDSRVILDISGAESLLGKGDMLFLPPEAGSPFRVQGVLVTDQEIEKVITYWQNAIPGIGVDTSPWDKMLDEESVLADRDQLVDKAIALIRDTQLASASMLQRKLRVGYPRAARLMDELEELGIVGPSTGGGRKREVLIDRDEEPI